MTADVDGWLVAARVAGVVEVAEALRVHGHDGTGRPEQVYARAAAYPVVVRDALVAAKAAHWAAVLAVRADCDRARVERDRLRAAIDALWAAAPEQIEQLRPPEGT